jgi:hypothetical protein
MALTILAGIQGIRPRQGGPAVGTAIRQSTRTSLRGTAADGALY